MVCKSSITSTGPTTAFRQQYSLLWASGVLHPDPRRQFLTDLQEFLVTHQTLGDRILLLGDFNTDLDHPQESRQLQDLLSLLHLTDVMTHCHPDLPPPATRQRGRRIDTIYACSALAHRNIKCGFGLYNSLVDSDHRPLFLDIPANILLG